MIIIPDKLRRPAEVERDELKKQLAEVRADAEQMQAAFKEILKIQRTVDLNLFDIEQVHSIAEAALVAAERPTNENPNK